MRSLFGRRRPALHKALGWRGRRDVRALSGESGRRADLGCRGAMGIAGSYGA